MADTFGSAWLTEFTDSKPRAVGELVWLIVSGGWAWYQWAIKADTTTTQVFVWMLVFAASAIAIVWFHARRIWMAEHRLRLSADERYENRPEVIPVFERAFKGEFVPTTDDVIRFENRGHEDSHNLEVSPVALGAWRVDFVPSYSPIRRDGGFVELTPRVVDERGGFVTGDLVWVLVRDKVNRAPDAMRFEWPLHVRYEDSRGRRFQTHGALMCDMEQRRVWFHFREAGRALPVN